LAVPDMRATLGVLQAGWSGPEVVSRKVIRGPVAGSGGRAIGRRETPVDRGFPDPRRPAV